MDREKAMDEYLPDPGFQWIEDNRDEDYYIDESSLGDGPTMDAVEQTKWKRMIQESQNRSRWLGR